MDARAGTGRLARGCIVGERLLEVLHGAQERNILPTLAARPPAAATLADELGASGPTVYRRLNSLESAGLIKSTVALDADGHHRKRFHVVVDSANLTFDSSGIEITALS